LPGDQKSKGDKEKRIGFLSFSPLVLKLLAKRDMKKLLLFTVAVVVYSTTYSQSATNGLADRQYWLEQLDKLARPILSNLANDNLRAAMPVALSKRTDNAASRTKAAYLEAFGRVLCGISPWLNLEGGAAKEVALRNQYREWTLKAIANAVNPQAKDYMPFQRPGQALVDASFFAFALVRCPWLWEHLNDSTRKQVVNALVLTRDIKPGFTNWILFSGMIEAFFCKYKMWWDQMRVDFCFRQFEQWYVGDGVYSDGPPYHWDYYNSYVIHPYLATMLEIVNKENNAYNWLTEKLKARNERYAVIQERMINTDGTYPITGRSIVYRGAAFHHLADIAWRQKLPAQLSPAQVRCALTAVIKKTMGQPSTFKDGWLTIGVYGSQPDLADVYNNTGSLYLCATILLPLGLPETDTFWSSPAAMWTSQKVWSGVDVPGDHAID
jgi:hypothetical protein